jgi:hypothetical protein
MLRRGNSFSIKVRCPGRISHLLKEVNVAWNPDIDLLKNR